MPALAWLLVVVSAALNGPALIVDNMNSRIVCHVTVLQSLCDARVFVTFVLQLALSAGGRSSSCPHFVAFDL